MNTHPTQVDTRGNKTDVCSIVLQLPAENTDDTKRFLVDHFRADQGYEITLKSDGYGPTHELKATVYFNPEALTDAHMRGPRPNLNKGCVPILLASVVITAVLIWWVFPTMQETAERQRQEQGIGR